MARKDKVSCRQLPCQVGCEKTNMESEEVSHKRAPLQIPCLLAGVYVLKPLFLLIVETFAEACASRAMN